MSKEPETQIDAELSPQEADPQQPSGAGDPAAEAEPSALEQTVVERDEARAAYDELLDRYRRAQAEFENARKRLTREQVDTREYAAMATIESLLPILDDFDRALDAPAVDPEYLKGLELIRERMTEVFQRAGLAPVETEGLFDPNLHQAVDRGSAESDDDDQRILEVYRLGYRFKERLLRPAMVKVAVKE